MMKGKLVIVALVGLLGLLAGVGIAQANHEKLDICCAWDDSLADGVLTYDLTYTVSGSSDAAQATVAAAVEDWETAVQAAVPGLPALPGFTLTPLVGGGKPDIKIRLNSGGGPIAGTAKRRFDGNFVKSVDLSISGKFLGEEVSQEILEEVARHEMGHALGVSHANFDDLMDPTVGGVTAISDCDVLGVREANHWALVDTPVIGPHVPHEDSIDCGTATAPDNDVTVTDVTASTDSATQGDIVVITVTVANHGNNEATFDVTLVESFDGTDGITWTTEDPVTLESGESIDLSGVWFTTTETTLGVHTLTATHSLNDGGLPDSDFAEVEIVEASGEDEPNCPTNSKAPHCS